jgi:hypothetical protein
MSEFVDNFKDHYISCTLIAINSEALQKKIDELNAAKEENARAGEWALVKAYKERIASVQKEMYILLKLLEESKDIAEIAV